MYVCVYGYIVCSVGLEGFPVFTRLFYDRYDVLASIGGKGLIPSRYVTLTETKEALPLVDAHCTLFLPFVLSRGNLAVIVQTLSLSYAYIRARIHPKRMHHTLQLFMAVFSTMTVK